MGFVGHQCPKHNAAATVERCGDCDDEMKFQRRDAIADLNEALALLRRVREEHNDEWKNGDRGIGHELAAVLCAYLDRHDAKARGEEG
jgi:hypothetical protein